MMHRMRIALWLVAVLLGYNAPSLAQQTPSWLDAPKPSPWNTPGAEIPAAPKVDGEGVDPRCRESARTPQSDEDKRLRSRGWNLVGDAHRRGDVLVILGTANYDGMCRPWQYQGFVFRGGVFAGTLSPQLMDSRTDGAIGHVSIAAGERLTVEYDRYAASDPLCCPSRKSRVTFEIAANPVALRPLTVVTTRASSR